ncbi:MAG: Uma2 family endonuclease [Cyclobacteriaceae bacterium]|nr:Uma2 family endonuclease [Cyclobacteriaceae bacterium]
MQSITTPPRTIMEVFKSLPEGTLAEIINGTIYMSPSPTPKHQRIVRKLAFAISNYVEVRGLGEVFFSPCDVFLDEHSSAVQPDIIFISKEKSSIVHENSGIHGIPDLLIEILSPGNADHELIRKRELYEKFGVPEYWIVNPDTKETIGFTLNNGKYEESGRLMGMIRSVLFQQQEFVF